jgi:hypothetical protein
VECSTCYPGYNTHIHVDPPPGIVRMGPGNLTLGCTWRGCLKNVLQSGGGQVLDGYTEILDGCPSRRSVEPATDIFYGAPRPYELSKTCRERSNGFEKLNSEVVGPSCRSFWWPDRFRVPKFVLQASLEHERRPMQWWRGGGVEWSVFGFKED